MKISKLPLIAMLVLQGASAGEFDKQIPLDQTSAATFYVAGDIDGYGAASMLVDTGSTYTTIDQTTLAQLEAGGNATYLRVLQGVMADGSKLKVKVYRISGISLGDGACVIRDVEAAVFPKGTRPILGLSALHKVSPFIFSMDPPALSLSNCNAHIAANEGEPIPAVSKATGASVAKALPHSVKGSPKAEAAMVSAPVAPSGK